MSLGTYQTDDGYAYDERLDGCLMQKLTRNTGAPFGRPVVQAVHNGEYATTEAATAFAAVLKGRGAIGIAPAEETATFITLNADGVIVPKWEILFAAKDGRPAIRVNAGIIATILGDDPDYGSNIGAKAGKIAEAIIETFDRDVHVPLTKALLGAAQAVAQ